MLVCDSNNGWLFEFEWPMFEFKFKFECGLECVFEFKLLFESEHDFVVSVLDSKTCDWSRISSSMSTVEVEGNSNSLGELLFWLSKSFIVSVSHSLKKGKNLKKYEYISVVTKNKLPVFRIDG